MDNLLFNQNKNVNIFEFTQKEKRKNGSYILVGNSFVDTREFAAHLLRCFIERDLFLAIKSNELPKININLLFDKFCGIERVSLKIEDTEEGGINCDSLGGNDESGVTNFGIYILNKIHQIIWNYNRIEYTESDNISKRRFYVRVLLPNKPISKKIYSQM